MTSLNPKPIVQPAKDLESVYHDTDGNSQAMLMTANSIKPPGTADSSMRMHMNSAQQIGRPLDQSNMTLAGYPSGDEVYDI